MPLYELSICGEIYSGPYIVRGERVDSGTFEADDLSKAVMIIVETLTRRGDILHRYDEFSKLEPFELRLPIHRSPNGEIVYRLLPNTPSMHDDRKVALAFFMSRNIVLMSIRQDSHPVLKNDIVNMIRRTLTDGQRNYLDKLLKIDETYFPQIKLEKPRREKPHS